MPGPLRPPATVAELCPPAGHYQLWRAAMEAWFTREVPVGDGPYKFYGLPGLIVKVRDTRGHYDFELTQLRQLVPPGAHRPAQSRRETSTKSEFRRGKAEDERNGLAQLLANGNIRYSSPSPKPPPGRRCATGPNAKPTRWNYSSRWLKPAPSH
ncbi:MAG: GLPGLI family protein [Hymenobacter sp.]